ncbi:hypothetical protein KEM60_00002 [Austwickia sp. TVS 96-490-7B]|uniref:RHS repeat-associated core domain-containing protein n=1 Tax=Austwickia sp. TVS 96-490-7B TaxID=2830843 RepID=UPI001C567A0D|nr:RHS repeat-associated core domain-containing protein [Austwickia sp. TVS 96-490-7B]MBW3083825.1 hypothetical protein [Austwickia sp. TVS 96-490-7B]
MAGFSYVRGEFPTEPVSGKAGCVRFAYDAGGRETQRAYPGGVIQYRGYDGSGRVVGISANSGVGARVTSQAYNYLAGAKDQANVQSWSTGNQLLGAGSSTYGRSILGLALSSRNMGGVATRYIAHPSGQNIGYVAPEGQAWFLSDKLGSVIGLVDSKGVLIGSYSYDPTGVNRANTATGALAARNIHRYAGGLFESATGLTRFGVRWYNPVTGRFTTPDPSGKEKNNYLYAGGNSCNRVDPSGEENSDACIIGGVIGAAVYGGLASLIMFEADLLSGGAAAFLNGAVTNAAGALGAGVGCNLAEKGLGSAADPGETPVQYLMRYK